MDRPDLSAEARIRRIVAQRLESLGRAGVAQLAVTSPTKDVETAADRDSGLVASPGATVSTASESRRTASDAASAAAPIQPPATQEPAMPQERDATSTGDEKRNALDALSRKVAECTRCRELAPTRTQTVFGVGDPQARLCFFGEGPGADEDRQGEPFVGRAGKLLNDIIAACTLERKDVYILNTVKCRPPGNRNPEPDEIANCREYFERQLEIIQPEFICCLGAVAARTLLETTESIGRLRGKFHDWRGIRVIATYHPAYLLRNPAAKKPTWEDMQMLMREMGIELPKRK